MAALLLTGCGPQSSLEAFLSRGAPPLLSVSRNEIRLEPRNASVDDCPTLGDEVRLLLNGVEKQFIERGGVRSTFSSGQLLSRCTTPRAVVYVFDGDEYYRYVPVTLERVEVVIADAHTQIVAQWQGVTNEADIRLVEGQSLERPGRLTFEVQNTKLGSLNLANYFRADAVMATQNVDGKPLETRRVPVDLEGSRIHVTTQRRTDDGVDLGPHLGINLPEFIPAPSRCEGVVCQLIGPSSPIRYSGSDAMVELAP